MAKSTKKRSARTSNPKVIDDAVVVSETKADKDLASALSEDVTDSAKDSASTVEDAANDMAVEDAMQNDTLNDDISTDEVSAQNDTVVEDAVVADEVVEPSKEPLPVVAPQNVTVQKVGFVPLVGGGLVAGGLGFAAAWFGLGQGGAGVQPLITEQAAQIEALDARVAAIPSEAAAPDLSGLEASLETIRGETTDGLAQITGQVSALEDRVTAFEGTLGETDTRLTAVERAPGENGEVTSAAIDSFERELAGLREEITAQEARMQEVADSAAADVADAQAQLAEAEAQAQAAAEAAQAEAEAAALEAQAALAAAAAAELRVALDAGEPFDTQVADLTAAGIDVPEALSAVAADGLPTQADLMGEFPDLARSALTVARSEGLADQDAGGVSSFFRDQFQTRSIAPREGDDPDAVLSRTEAAVGAGDLDTALTEISALPEPVQAVFADWLASAEARAAAMAAANTLVSNENN